MYQGLRPAQLRHGARRLVDPGGLRLRQPLLRAGKLFAESVNLFTRYRPRLLSLITSQFFSPDFNKPKNENRLTDKVEHMKMGENLPHLCECKRIWTKMKGSSLEGKLLETTVSTSDPARGYGWTGSWGLQRK